MRAIVTGGAGFIGSHVCEALVARGDEVHALDNLSSGRRENLAVGVTLHVADVREPLGSLFDEVRPEVVIHLASQIDVRVSVAEPVADALANVIGTINVVQAALPHRAQVVFSSTGGAIYGECAGPAAEDAPRLPLAPYGTSKLAAEEYLAMWNRLHGTGHTSLRLGNVYGPRQDPHGEAGVVAIFLKTLQNDRPATIFGDGAQTRDYVFAGDVAQAALAAIGRPGGVFNIGTGHETSVVDLWRACCATTGLAHNAFHEAPRLGEIQRSVLDPTRAADSLDWRASTPLDEGLRQTWDWLRTT